jgi:uncharacterized protein
MEINNPEVIKRILHECLTVAVVGLSSNPLSDSFNVAEHMKDLGYRVIPVNQHETEVLGERAYPLLDEIPEPIDLVNIFLRQDEIGAAVDDAIKIGAKAVWMQERVIDEDAANRAFDAGLMVVMDRCWLKEHMKNI